jgi:hypothetical protein
MNRESWLSHWNINGQSGQSDNFPGRVSLSIPGGSTPLNRHKSYPRQQFQASSFIIIGIFQSLPLALDIFSAAFDMLAGRFAKGEWLN